MTDMITCILNINGCSGWHWEWVNVRCCVYRLQCTRLRGTAIFGIRCFKRVMSTWFDFINSLATPFVLWVSCIWYSMSSTLEWPACCGIMSFLQRFRTRIIRTILQCLPFGICFCLWFVPYFWDWLWPRFGGRNMNCFIIRILWGRLWWLLECVGTQRVRGIISFHRLSCIRSISCCWCWSRLEFVISLTSRRCQVFTV